MAPFYGAETTAMRAGWCKELLDRIACCEYPQFLIEVLPLPRTTTRSVLRFDHLQPVGKHHDAFTSTTHCLGEEALELVDEWIEWLFTGELPEETALAAARDELMSESPASGS
jgi:hypothetical protein